MSVLVALETSTRCPSVAVEREGERRELWLERERSHASDLVPALDAALRELGASPADVSGVLVATGPGSYTGLRVGVATALGLARGSGAGLRGLGSGEALAYAELAEGEECCHVLDVRQGGLAFARYRRTRDDVRVLEPPCVLTPAELAQRLPAGAKLFFGPGAIEAAGLARGELERLREDAVPRAGAVLELGARRLAAQGAHRPEEIEPLYLRAFAAMPRRRS